MLEYDNLLEILKNNSDKKFDDFNKKIINSGVQTIGCKTPFIRKLAKNYTLEQVLAFPSHEFYEVDLLKGIVISSCKLPFEQKIHLLTDFVASIDNWAICDLNCIKVRATEKEQYFDYFCGLMSDDRVFVCRYGIVNLLSSYLEDKYIDRIFDSLKQIRIWGEYYVDVAAAWLLATAIVKCHDKTLNYMEGDGRHVLNKFAYNRALQKMRDSFRVSDEDKKWTFKMKMV